MSTEHFCSAGQQVMANGWDPNRRANCKTPKNKSSVESLHKGMQNLTQEACFCRTDKSGTTRQCEATKLNKLITQRVRSLRLGRRLMRILRRRCRSDCARLRDVVRVRHATTPEALERLPFDPQRPSPGSVKRWQSAS